MGVHNLHQSISKTLSSNGALHTSSPHYPQSNGKAQATVKSVKRIMPLLGVRKHSMNTNCALLFFRIGTLHHVKMDFHMLRNSLVGLIQDTLSVHQYSLAPKWQCSAQLAEQQATKTLQQTESYCNSHAHRILDLQTDSMVALQNPLKKLSDMQIPHNLNGTPVSHVRDMGRVHHT